MLDLEQDAVTAWLTELRPQSAEAEWPPAIRPKETQGRVADHMTGLAAALHQAGGERPERLAHALRTDLRAELTAVLAQCGAARSLRVIHWIAETDLPDCHAIIGALLQENGAAARALRATSDAVTRAATLRRVFSPERVAALEAACRATTEQQA